MALRTRLASSFGLMVGSTGNFSVAGTDAAASIATSGPEIDKG